MEFLISAKSAPWSPIGNPPSFCQVTLTLSTEIRLIPWYAKTHRSLPPVEGFSSLCNQDVDARRMSLLGLPLEIRELIYQELLCPSQGIYLKHGGFKRYLRTNNIQRYNQQEEIIRWQRTLRDDEKNPEELKESPIGAEDLGDAIAVPPSATSITYVNRQISEEASRILYRRNRFRFDVAPVLILKFLKDPDNTLKQHIVEIGLEDWATASDSESMVQWWTRLFTFLRKRMHINTVTIKVPHDMYQKINKDKYWEQGPRSNLFGWWTVDSFLDLLIDWKIKSLRLAYPGTYLENHCQEKNTGVAEGFHAIRMLWNWPDGRSRRELVVTRKEGLASDIGTVLEITRASLS